MVPIDVVVIVETGTVTIPVAIGGFVPKRVALLTTLTPLFIGGKLPVTLPTILPTLADESAELVRIGVFGLLLLLNVVVGELL